MSIPRTIFHPPEGFLPGGEKLGGWWHETEEAGRLVCDLCPRACNLKSGDRGFCFVRQNRDDQMVLTTYGRSTGFCIDPIEKKPLNHFLPGTSVLSFGTAGCNLGCKFCQNHDISKAREVELLSAVATPETIAHAAVELGCASVAYTYNDPVIWAEYAIDTAKACRELHLQSVAVTAGYINPQARHSFFEFFDAVNIDLKGFTEEFYLHLTLARLQPVLDTIKWLKRETDIWFEITNLVIPNVNDSTDELRRLCDWLLTHVGDDVPIHFSAFHPDFKMLDHPRTPLETLVRGYETARAAGLKFAYVGNVDDVKHQSTYCPGCGTLLIERNWYELGRYHISDHACAHCGEKIAGRFLDSPGSWGRRRQPVQISHYAQEPEKQTISVAETERVPCHGGESVSTTNLEEDALSGGPQLLEGPQQKNVLAAACELVAAAVTDRDACLDQVFANVAKLPINGAYVSLKRNGKLRGCCGFSGQPTTIGTAITHAAKQTASHDPRLPPVSPIELRYLEVEVWLLQAPVLIDRQGKSRLSEVKIGRDGLIVAHGNSRGLLLPGVATNLKLDATQFLRQVCRKAGLPPSAWHDNDTVLHRFEGQCISGPFDEDAWQRSAHQSQQIMSDDEFQLLVAHCRKNVRLLHQGAVANCYLQGISDGMVNGLTVTIKHDSGLPIHLSRISLRPPMPLQSTLYSLAENAARVLSGQGIDAEKCMIELTILSDPSMQGTLAEPDLRGVESSRRALLVLSGNHSACLFDPGVAAEQIVNRMRASLQLPEGQDAAIHSLAILSSDGSLEITKAPRPQTGQSSRPPAVAGKFYPADATEMKRAVDKLSPKAMVAKRPWRAAMIPHAAWRYSGHIAAQVLAHIDIPETVIVIGPKHSRVGMNCAVAPHERWSLPGIEVASDTTLADELAAAIPGLERDTLAHRDEHSIEVVLPILHRLAPQSKVVGMVLGIGDWNLCQAVAAGLEQVLRARNDRLLLVISSDMNHFARDDENRRLDEIAMQALEELDAESLLRTIHKHEISMCGLLPAVSILHALEKIKPLMKAQRVVYATSADVSGDVSRVVGYSGMLFE